MTVSHAHARNACAHEQSTNIESGAVQRHKQLAERATFATNLSQSRPFATNGKPIKAKAENQFFFLVILSNVEGSSEAKRKKQRAVCA